MGALKKIIKSLGHRMYHQKLERTSVLSTVRLDIVNFTALESTQAYLAWFLLKYFLNLIMQKLTINIPNSKSDLVKRILKGLGIDIQNESKISSSDYRAKLKKISTWSEEELQNFEEGKKAFETLKPQQW